MISGSEGRTPSDPSLRPPLPRAARTTTSHYRDVPTPEAGVALSCRSPSGFSLQDPLATCGRGSWGPEMCQAQVSETASAPRRERNRRAPGGLVQALRTLRRAFFFKRSAPELLERFDTRSDGPGPDSRRRVQLERRPPLTSETLPRHRRETFLPKPPHSPQV